MNNATTKQNERKGDKVEDSPPQNQKSLQENYNNKPDNNQRPYKGKDNRSDIFNQKEFEPRYGAKPQAQPTPDKELRKQNMPEEPTQPRPYKGKDNRSDIFNQREVQNSRGGNKPQPQAQPSTDEDVKKPVTPNETQEPRPYKGKDIRSDIFNQKVPETRKPKQPVDDVRKSDIFHRKDEDGKVQEEPQKNENSSIQMNKASAQILDKFRERLLSRGGKGIIGLQRQFKIFDDIKL